MGIEVRRIRRSSVPAVEKQPIGDISIFLNALRRRDFLPRGIIDVGANRGNWTRLALSVFPGTPVIMIEPQDEMESYLSQLITERPNCCYVKAGAGRKEGELIQTIWDDLTGSSFLPETDAQKLETGGQRKARIVTIDSLLTGLYAGFLPDLVKLDIQGFELEALSGAEITFGRTEVFVIETSLFQFESRMPITSDVIAFMAERSYELYDITEYLRRPYDGALGQVDLAFVKKAGQFRRESKW
jgi:FkbM family methyltransferase